MIELKPIHYIEIFKIKIYVWGLLVLLSILISFFLVYRKVKEEKLKGDVVYDLLLISVIFGFLGARLLYALENGFEDFFYINKGGLSFYGSLLAYLMLVLYLKIKKISFRYLEIIFIFLPLAQAIGRIGCFLNWDDYGLYTNLPFGIKVGDDLPRHPSQLYEALCCLIIFFVLFFLDKRKKEVKPTKLYFLLYPFTRFMLDFLRDSKRYFGLTLAQYISIPLFFITFWLTFKDIHK
jgi:phosphatidylglycerol:prolipoprotein diacylglycerol transferase